MVSSNFILGLLKHPKHPVYGLATGKFSQSPAKGMSFFHQIVILSAFTQN